MRAPHVPRKHDLRYDLGAMASRPWLPCVRHLLGSLPDAEIADRAGIHVATIVRVRQDLGIVAAHVKWKQAGGPDDVPNGIAMCVLHHRAFDRGVFTIKTDLRLSISADLVGGSSIHAMFLDLHGKEVRRPHAPQYEPKSEFLEWHHEQVFHAPARGQ